MEARSRASEDTLNFLCVEGAILDKVSASEEEGPISSRVPVLEDKKDKKRKTAARSEEQLTQLTGRVSESNAAAFRGIVKEDTESGLNRIKIEMIVEVGKTVDKKIVPMKKELSELTERIENKQQQLAIHLT